MLLQKELPLVTFFHFATRHFSHYLNLTFLNRHYFSLFYLISNIICKNHSRNRLIRFFLRLRQRRITERNFSLCSPFNRFNFSDPYYLLIFANSNFVNWIKFEQIFLSCQEGFNLDQYNLR